MTSEVIKVSNFLRDWGGKLSRSYPTTNSKVCDYLIDGKDSKLTIVLLKQLRKYEPDIYFLLLREGVVIEYQGMTFDLLRSDGGVHGVVYNKAMTRIGEVLIKRDKVTALEPIGNNDALGVFRELSDME